MKAIIRGGRLVDPANGINGFYDICIDGEKIDAVEKRIATKKPVKEINAEGKLVLPGLVDMHVHISSDPAGFRMLARAGVTTALDMNGRGDKILKSARAARTGLTAAFVYGLIPGDTVSSSAPSHREIEKLTAGVLAQGALGLKILGGHYPLTPQAIYDALKTAEKFNCYCAVHAGSTENGSNIQGLRELMSLRENMPLHIAHINSYCRGQIYGNPQVEAAEAVKLLNSAVNVKSESYLSQINGTSAKIQDGVPVSHVTRACLAAGNYPATVKGLEAAILDGWAQVNGVNKDKETTLLSPREGIESFFAKKGNLGISFAVNDPGTLSLLAAARKDDGSFSVDAISTDGGVIPRNETLKHGLSLVENNELTIEDFVSKTSLVPAKILGLKSKGRLSPGADADVIIVDPCSKMVETMLCRGEAIIKNAQISGEKDCLFVTTNPGGKFFEKYNVSCIETLPNYE